MAGVPAASSINGIWAQQRGGLPVGPLPGGTLGAMNLPVVNNPNSLPYSTANPPSGPMTALPRLPPVGAPLNAAAGPLSNNYPTPNYPALNSIAANIAAANANQNAQNEAYQRRLTQLEDENALRRNTTATMQQMGSQILQGQMDVQEQVLEYQFMLEQCMDTLDQQNQILNEQAEELGLLRSKMRHLEFFSDAYKHSKEGNRILQNMNQCANINDNNVLCCGDPLALPPPSTSPFFTGTPTRVTASTFQPFNPRYRSPNSRAKTASTLNERRSTTPANTPRPTAAERPARRFGTANN